MPENVGVAADAEAEVDEEEQKNINGFVKSKAAESLNQVNLCVNAMQGMKTDGKLSWEQWQKTHLGSKNLNAWINISEKGIS